MRRLSLAPQASTTSSRTESFQTLCRRAIPLLTSTIPMRRTARKCYIDRLLTICYRCVTCIPRCPIETRHYGDLVQTLFLAGEWVRKQHPSTCQSAQITFLAPATESTSMFGEGSLNGLPETSIRKAD